MNTTLSSRMMELLEQVADAFIRNANPFDVEWMTQHDVTLQECADLSELIGNVLCDHVYLQKEGGDAG